MRRTFPAALRTAGITAGVVIEPPETGAVDVRAACRRRARRRGRAARPSSSAATIRADVSVPVPMSWMPVVTSARASASRRTVACAGGPPPPHQICVAQPMPRRSPSGCGSRSASRRVPAGELGRAVVAGEQPLARVGKARALVAVDVVPAAQLERVDARARRRARPSPARAPSRPRRRPARGTRSARGGSSAPGRPSRGRSRTRRSRAPARRRGRSSRRRPCRRRPRARSPASVPSRRAPSVTVWRVHERRPPTTCSSWRPSARRTGRPAARASSAARSASIPAPCFAPKPPPMYSEITRTCSGREVEAPRELAPRVEDPLRRDPCRERVALPAGDGGVRLERRLHVRGRLAGQLDARVGAGERGVGVAADRLARVLGEALLGRGRPRARAAPAPRSSGARAARPAVAASGVSAATAATGAPAQRRLGGEQRLSPPIVNGPSGPSTARTPGVARAASRSSPVTRQRATGARSTSAWSIPGELRRRPCSGPRRPPARARPGAAPACRRRRSSASSGHVSTSSSSSTRTQTSSKRPSISRCDLTSRGFTRSPAPTRGGSRARSSGTRRSGRCCPPSRARISSRLGRGVGREQRGRRDDLPRRAEAALERVLGDEGLLQRGAVRGRGPRSS